MRGRHGGYRLTSGYRMPPLMHPYGLVAHSGRWYVIGADPTIGEDPTFRLETRLAEGRLGVALGEEPAQARAELEACVADTQALVLAALRTVYPAV